MADHFVNFFLNWHLGAGNIFKHVVQDLSLVTKNFVCPLVGSIYTVIQMGTLWCKKKKKNHKTHAEKQR